MLDRNLQVIVQPNVAESSDIKPTCADCPSCGAKFLPLQRRSQLPGPCIRCNCPPVRAVRPVESRADLAGARRSSQLALTEVRPTATQKLATAAYQNSEGNRLVARRQLQQRWSSLCSRWMRQQTCVEALFQGWSEHLLPHRQPHMGMLVVASAPAPKHRQSLEKGPLNHVVCS